VEAKHPDYDGDEMASEVSDQEEEPACAFSYVDGDKGYD